VVMHAMGFPPWLARDTEWLKGWAALSRERRLENV